MAKKQTRSSRLKKELAPKPYEVKTKKKADVLVPDNISVKGQMKGDVNKRLCHKDVLRKTAPTVIGGFPIPQHNFPTPLGPQDRDYDYHPFIDEVNTTIRKLNGLRVNLYDVGVGPRGQPELTTLSTMKLLIQNESLPKLLRQLRSVALLPSDNPSETLYPYCRDTLVNIGAGLFTCGLFLIMMGSNSDDGAEATAANYHLEKGVYQGNAATCQSCGHTNCDPAKGCDSDVVERTNHGSRWL